MTALIVDANFSGATASTQVGGSLVGTGIVEGFANNSRGTINPGGSGTGGILSTVSGAASASVLSGETFQTDITDLRPLRPTRYRGHTPRDQSCRTRP